jgi:hypothetical protein
MHVHTEEKFSASHPPTKPSSSYSRPQLSHFVKKQDPLNFTPIPSTTTEMPTEAEKAADIAFWLPLDLAFVVADKVIRQARSFEASTDLQASVFYRRGAGAFVPLARGDGTPSEEDHFCSESISQEVTAAEPITHLTSRYEPHTEQGNKEHEEPRKSPWTDPRRRPPSRTHKASFFGEDTSTTANGLIPTTTHSSQAARIVQGAEAWESKAGNHSGFDAFYGNGADQNCHA